MEYSSGIRNDDILPIMTTQINPENILLREISKSENSSKNYVISHIGGI